MVHLPTSIYLGWISIATIANATALLVFYKWNRFGMSQQFWAVLMIILGVVVGLVLLFSRNDIFYALAIDWAVLGILLKRLAVDGSETRGVVVASLISICVLSAGVAVQTARGKIYR